MRIVARLNKVTVTPGKPVQIVFTAETAHVLENFGLVELAQMDEETDCFLNITPMQSNLPFESGVKTEIKVTK